MRSFEQTPNPVIPIDVYASDGALEAGRLTAYTPEAAAGIGALMPDLDPNFSSEPTPEWLLRRMTASPDTYGQIVAVRDKIHVVGAATVGVVVGAGLGIRGQLEDVITKPSERGRVEGQNLNAAALIWKSILTWHAENDLKEFAFESELDRVPARNYYMKLGAVLPEPVTAPSHFKYVLTEADHELARNK